MESIYGGTPLFSAFVVVFDRVLHPHLGVDVAAGGVFRRSEGELVAFVLRLYGFETHTLGRIRQGEFSHR